MKASVFRLVPYEPHFHCQVTALPLHNQTRVSDVIPVGEHAARSHAHPERPAHTGRLLCKHVIHVFMLMKNPGQCWISGPKHIQPLIFCFWLCNIWLKPPLNRLLQTLMCLFLLSNRVCSLFDCPGWCSNIMVDVLFVAVVFVGVLSFRTFSLKKMEIFAWINRREQN